MLADTRGDDCAPLRVLVDLFDHRVRLDHRRLAVEVHRVSLLQLCNLRMPARVRALRFRIETGLHAVFAQAVERTHQVAEVMPIDALDLVDLGRIDVEMSDKFRSGRELVRHTGDAIVETAADRDKEITVFHRVVGERRAVHAEHVQRQRLRRIGCADAHQRRHRRQAERLRERTQRLRRFGQDHATAGIDQRPLGFGQFVEKRLARGGVERRPRDIVETRTIPGQRQAHRAVENEIGVLHVLRNIDDDRAGAAGTRNLERTAQRRFELRCVGDEEHMLRARAHDAADRRFLESVAADRRGRHLAADDDDRNRVGHRIAHRRDRVRRTGAGRDDRHADLARSARITLRHETRTLLVRRHDQRQHVAAFRGGTTVVVLMLVVIAEHRIVDRQNRAARVAEYDVDALVGKHLYDDIRAGQVLAGQRVLGRCLRGRCLRRFELCVHDFCSCLPFSHREKVPEGRMRETRCDLERQRAMQGSSLIRRCRPTFSRREKESNLTSAR